MSLLQMHFHGRIGEYFADFSSGGGGLEDGFAEVVFKGDGTVIIDNNASVAMIQNWVIPNSVAQYKSHWFRPRNFIGNSSEYSGPTLNQWTQLQPGSSNQLSWFLGSTYNTSYGVDLDIALDSAGTQIVATGGITLDVSVA